MVGLESVKLKLQNAVRDNLYSNGNIVFGWDRNRIDVTLRYRDSMDLSARQMEAWYIHMR